MPSNIKAKGGFVSAMSKYKAPLEDYFSIEVKVRNNLPKVYVTLYIKPII